MLGEAPAKEETPISDEQIITNIAIHSGGNRARIEWVRAMTTDAMRHHWQAGRMAKKYVVKLEGHDRLELPGGHRRGCWLGRGCLLWCDEGAQLELIYDGWNRLVERPIYPPE